MNLPTIAPAAEYALRALVAMDLTSLGEDDDHDRILRLCASARTPFGLPAALCVQPEWIASCREELARLGIAEVRVASVVNFPDGGADLERARRETRRALAAGAQEIDLVFPWRAFRDGEHALAARLVQGCKAACGDGVLLKVILETGSLQDPQLVRAAAESALAAGADFLKTSTGTAAVNATPEAARILLETIREHGGRCGFKAAGGIRRVGDAGVYLDLADRIMGRDWVTPRHFRLGASALLADVLATLGGAGAAASRHGHARY